MGIAEALLLGVVQGLTEFLPISSTAHVRVVPALLGWEDPGAGFTAVIQLGTLLAVILYFRSDLARALGGWLRSFWDVKARSSADARIGWAICAGTVPIVVAGLFFKERIENQWRSLEVVAIALIAVGLLLLAAEELSKHRRGVDETRVRDGFWVGLWQALALVPGVSRSGITIAGALFAGFDRPAAARLSFLLSVPSVVGAAALSAYSHRELFQSMLGPILVANVAALASGYAAIAGLLRFLQRHGTYAFIAYRIALGLGLLLALRSGWLSA